MSAHVRPPDHPNDCAPTVATDEAQGDTTNDDANPNTEPAARYALIDRRRDGRPRIVGEYTDPKAARDAAILMRWAGDAVEIVLLTAIVDEAP